MIHRQERTRTHTKTILSLRNNTLNGIFRACGVKLNGNLRAMDYTRLENIEIDNNNMQLLNTIRIKPI